MKNVKLFLMVITALLMVGCASLASGAGTFFTVSGKSKFEKKVSSELANEEISTTRLSE